MVTKIISMRFILLCTIMGALLLGACQGGQISIDVSGGNSGSGADEGTGSVSGQTFFMLMIVLLVAMFAMVLVAVSR